MLHRVRGREGFRQPAHDAGKIQNSEEDEHQADGELHGEADASGNDDAAKRMMAEPTARIVSVWPSPQETPMRAAWRSRAALAADDGGDGDDVVGIGGVTHAEEETENDDRGCRVIIFFLEGS